MDLRGLAEAAEGAWPRDDVAARAFTEACSPGLILALLDVAEAADGTHQVRASTKSRWWAEDGMAGSGVADQKLRAALARWHEVSP
jgi:hypothetical protein